MIISLIVTSQGNTIALERLFESLTKQKNISKNTLEIIFADQNDDRELVASFSKNLRIIHKLINKTSLSSARNQVLTHASGKILAFPDDDCWYHDLFFNEVIEYFETNPKSSMFISNIYDPTNNKYYGKRPVKKAFLTNKSIYYLPSSISIFINRNVIYNNVVFFNETLGLGTKWGSGEDIELAFKVFKNNPNCFYDGTKTVYHPVITGGGNMKKAYSYGRGSGALAANLFLKGNYNHLFIYGNYIVKSALGCSYYLFTFKFSSSKVYYSRLKGLLSGFVKGYVFFKNQN